MTYQDYILRQIQLAGQAWSRVVRLLRDRKYAGAQIAIDQAFRELLGMSPELARSRDPRDQIARLRFGVSAEAGRDKALTLVMLLKAAGDLAHMQEDELDALDAYHLALRVLLLTLLDTPDFTLPDYVPAVDTLTADLDRAALPVQTQRLLLRYYEQTGAYAQAEDSLWAMLDAAPDDCAIVSEGTTFYTRLQQQDAAALLSGNLPRDEVDAGLTKLAAYAAEHGC